jgi:hypothetical protein
MGRNLTYFTPKPYALDPVPYLLPRKNKKSLDE